VCTDTDVFIVIGIVWVYWVSVFVYEGVHCYWSSKDEQSILLYIWKKSYLLQNKFQNIKKKILYANEVLFHHSLNALRKGWRFQRGNQKLSIKRQHNTQVKETKKWYTKNKDWEKVVWFMVFSVTFNHISVIWRLSVSLVEDTWENHLPVGSRWQTWSHNVVSTTPRHGRDSNSQL
jgi:hypothetical protein